MKRILFITISVLAFLAIYFYLRQVMDFSLQTHFLKIQRLGNKLLYEHINSLRQNADLRVFLILFGVSFLYGVLHSAGPGHGKVVISGYLVDNNLRKSLALKISFITSLTHTGSAIFLALLFWTILSYVTVFSRIEMIERFRFFSGTLIGLVGVLILTGGIKRKSGKPLVPIGRISQKYSMITIGILAGMIPCPVSMSIMLLSLSAGIFYVGLVSVFGISLGMFTLLLGVGLFVIASRDRLLNSLEEDHVWGRKRFLKLLHYLQGAIFVVVGLFMIRIL